jgi:hypothetical protein
VGDPVGLDDEKQQQQRRSGRHHIAEFHPAGLFLIAAQR